MTGNNYTIEPQWISARALGKMCGWTEAKAAFMLEEFLLRGMVETNGTKYRLVGRGLQIGEMMGTTVPLEKAVGIITSLSAKKDIDTTH